MCFKESFRTVKRIQLNWLWWYHFLLPVNNSIGAIYKYTLKCVLTWIVRQYFTYKMTREQSHWDIVLFCVKSMRGFLPIFYSADQNPNKATVNPLWRREFIANVGGRGKEMEGDPFGVAGVPPRHWRTSCRARGTSDNLKQGTGRAWWPPVNHHFKLLFHCLHWCSGNDFGSYTAVCSEK